MHTALDSIGEKIERAKEHQNALQSETTRFIKENPLRPAGEFDPQTGWHVHRLYDVPRVDPRLSIIVGDLVHNLRSALDHLVWALVKRTGAKPGKHNSYPIFSDVDDFFCAVTRPARARGRGPLGGLESANDMWAIIETTQPYLRREPHLHPLAILNDFWNIDKHRALHSAVMRPDAPLDLLPLFSWNRAAGEPLEQVFELRAGAPIKEGTKIARFRFAPGSADPQVHMKGEMPAEVTFGEGERVPGSDTFGRLGEYVELILQDFVRFFP